MLIWYLAFQGDRSPRGGNKAGKRSWVLGLRQLEGGRWYGFGFEHSRKSSSHVKKKLSEKANSIKKRSCDECKLFIVWRPAGCKMCAASFDVKPPRRLYGLMVVLDQLNDHSQILPISHMTVYLIFSDALPWTFRNALMPWKNFKPWLSLTFQKLVLTLLLRNKGLGNIVV